MAGLNDARSRRRTTCTTPQVGGVATVSAATGSPSSSRKERDGTVSAPRPIATFAPPTERTDEWADRPDKEILREIDLPRFEALVRRILLSEGLPPDVVFDFEPLKARCKVHLGSVRVSLRPPTGGPVRVTHCGCDNWLRPVETPPEDTAGMAQDLADEILWYWRDHADTLTMVAEVAEACEIEAAKARSLGLDSWFVDAAPADFQTFNGRRQHASASFDLIHDSLFKQRWTRAFFRPSDARKFFQSLRLNQRALAERRDELAVAGAAGAIDRLALAGILHLGLDPLSVIAGLAKSASDRHFNLGGATLLLHWRLKAIRGALLMPPGTSMAQGRLNDVRSGRDHLHPFGQGAVGKILSSPLIARGTRLRCERGSSDWIDAEHAECDLFALQDGVATWVRTPR